MGKHRSLGWCFLPDYRWTWCEFGRSVLGASLRRRRCFLWCSFLAPQMSASRSRLRADAEALWLQGTGRMSERVGSIAGVGSSA